MRDFFIQYLANLFSGFTLALLGFGVYKKIFKNKSKITQNNEHGSNETNNINNQYNISGTDPIKIEELLKMTSKNKEK